jgi:ABC-2 type transport system ATP-binding protein
MLAGIYTPTSGSIQVNGSLTPFIELGVGFNPELTGRENVYLNGALLGFNRKQMEAMYDDIVEFAELERFMDQKLKNYSSGMQVRLAFSIAIRARIDILLLDEVLAVGDEAFQRKCYDYFAKIKKGNKTVILVTHDMSSVERFCSRALLLDNGIVKSLGNPNEIAKQYTLDNMNSEKKNTGINADDGSNKKLAKEVSSLEIELISKQILKPSESLEFEVKYTLNEKIAIELGISIGYQSVSLLEHNTKELELSYVPNKVHAIKYTYPLKHLNPGRYELSVAMFTKDEFKLIGFSTETCSFIVDDEGKKRGGVISERGEWSVVR